MTAKDPRIKKGSVMIAGRRIKFGATMVVNIREKNYSYLKILRTRVKILLPKILNHPLVLLLRERMTNQIGLKMMKVPLMGNSLSYVENASISSNKNMADGIHMIIPMPIRHPNIKAKIQPVPKI